MSAYLVSPEQIAEMVKWAKSRPRGSITSYNIYTKKKLNTEPEALVKTLAQANVDSVNYRYKEYPTENFVAICLAELKSGPISLVGKSYVPDRSLTAADIYRMCSNYEYQACEPDDWITKDAYWIVQSIKHMAANIMSDVATHKWGYEKGAA